MTKTETLVPVEETKQFSDWLGRWSEMIHDHTRVHLSNLAKIPSYMTDLEYTKGKKYIKIISAKGGQRSVMGFVDRKTGDIYKPAGWSAPAKHIRGNLFDETGGMNCITIYGVVSYR